MLLTLFAAHEEVISQVMIVDQSGNGHFRQLKHAIDSLPISNTRWIEIQLRPGVYRYVWNIIFNKLSLFFLFNINFNIF